MTELKRRILVCCLILRWYHRILLSELKALEALLIRASTSALRLQSSLIVLPRYSKLETTLTGSESGQSVMASGLGNCSLTESPDGKTAMVLVFFVLIVRPIC